MPIGIYQLVPMINFTEGAQNDFLTFQCIPLHAQMFYHWSFHSFNTSIGPSHLIHLF